MRLAIGMQGVVKATAIVDGFALLVELHPCGADPNTISRTTAALAGTLQALEDGTWAARKRTDTPTTIRSTTAGA